MTDLEAEIVIIGAGPAGVAAACAAAEAGADTLLLDENPAPGGQIWRRGTQSVPAAAQSWMRRLERSGARCETGVAIFDAQLHSDQLSENQSAGVEGTSLLAERAGRAVRIFGRHLVIATGARELFLPFPGWTLPGVLGIGGLQAMVKSGAVMTHQRVVVAGSGPLILPVAATLADKGATLAVVAEQAPSSELRRFALGLWRWPAKWAQAAALRRRFLSTRYRSGTWVTRAMGSQHLEAVELTDGRRTWTEPCDLLAASYGLVPNIELARLLGCRVSQQAIETDAAQLSTLDRIWAAGEVCGVGGVEVALAEGEIAGLAAAGQPIPSPLLRRRDSARSFASLLEAAFAPRRELAERVRPETTICRCEDVAWQRIDPSWSMRQAKLYLRAGMGPCQGRICSPILQHLCGWEADSIRSPLKPVAARLLAEAGHDDPGSSHRLPEADKTP